MLPTTASSSAPAFTISAGGQTRLTDFLRKDPYYAAMDYLRGDILIRGDLVAAIRYYAAQKHSALRVSVMGALAKVAHSRLGSWFQRMRIPADDIAFHYDQSNEFYAQFLGEQMVYSCAYFQSESEPLEIAQNAKLEHICRKLSVGPEDRMLDIGCGWGSLLIHAAQRFGARGAGYTLSHEQAEFARERVAELGLTRLIQIHEADYRTAVGRFTKIASVGMFEHVGHARLGEYFQRVYSLLEDDGLFLNHGIVRPDGIAVDAQTLFLDRHVFPGAGLVSLGEVIGASSLAGFETVDVENLRPHYALTCREWVRRLQAAEQRCIELVGERAYRTWLLYLAASAANFEDGFTEIHQVLLAKRGQRGRKWLTREFLYRKSELPGERHSH